MQLVPGGDIFSACNDVDVADFNRDGIQDLVVPLGNGRGNAILIGNGNGTVQPQVSYLLPPPQSSIGGIFITSSDFNGDGKPDIALEVGGASPALNVLINSTSAATDTVSITRAEYRTSNRTLRVEATSTRADATLQVFVTSSGQLIGTLANNGGGRFRGQFSWPVNPQNITVRSNFGGQVTRTVTVR